METWGDLSSEQNGIVHLRIPLNTINPVLSSVLYIICYLDRLS